jgi:hypothetical protein
MFCYGPQHFVDENTTKPNVILCYDMIKCKLTIYMVDIQKDV